VSASEATDQEMRAAVERWARARGFTDGMAPWYAMFVEDRIRISRRHSDYKHRAEVGRPLYERTETSGHAALVWALVLEARPLRDGSRCKRCRGRGEWSWWEVGDGPRPNWTRWARIESRRECVALVGGPWAVGTRLTWDRLGGAAHWRSEPADGEPGPWCTHVTGDCPDCGGTGLADLTDAYAQHVLDAQPRLSVLMTTPTPWSEPSPPRRHHSPGNRASIEALHVLADRLQANPASTRQRTGFDSSQSYEHAETLGHAWARKRGGTGITVESKLPHTEGDPWHVALSWSEPDPLGLHLAHLLAGSREGTADAVERLKFATLTHRVAEQERRLAEQGLTHETALAQANAEYDRTHVPPEPDLAGQLAEIIGLRPGESLDVRPDPTRFGHILTIAETLAAARLANGYHPIDHGREAFERTRAIAEPLRRVWTSPGLEAGFDMVEHVTLSLLPWRQQSADQRAQWREHAAREWHGSLSTMERSNAAAWASGIDPDRVLLDLLDNSPDDMHPSDLARLLAARRRRGPSPLPGQG
jgi:hypothetical protein